ncbi:MAG: helix-turn-helix transcriptional regulator, partial [Candidatus Marinimicrobia bacterium]|nr:helix-turn-helix transcriptional regulator [Candidatus Neomarinimicrobiota bacterium]
AVELCVCDLADILEMDVSAISHQLKNLKEKGFLKKRRDGLTIYYRLSINEDCIDVFKFVQSIFSHELQLEK